MTDEMVRSYARRAAMRRLRTGERFEVVKNFYNESALGGLFGARARDLANDEKSRLSGP